MIKQTTPPIRKRAHLLTFELIIPAKITPAKTSFDISNKYFPNSFFIDTNIWFIIQIIKHMSLFFIPRGIHMVVLGYFLVDLLRLLGIYLLDELSGNSGVDTARLYDCLA